MSFEDMLDSETRRESQEYVDVGEAKISIEEHHPCPEALEGIGEVDYDMRFPYAPFAAGKRKDLHISVSLS